MNPASFPKKYRQKRGRMQFVAWLVYELNKRGENLSPNPNYADLMASVQRTLMNRSDLNARP